RGVVPRRIPFTHTSAPSGDEVNVTFAGPLLKSAPHPATAATSATESPACISLRIRPSIGSSPLSQAGADRLPATPLAVGTAGVRGGKRVMGGCDSRLAD